MKKIFLLILLISLLSISLSAEKTEYSFKKAMAYSLLFPGGGELYLHKYTTAGILFASEIAVIFSFSRMKHQVKWEENTYKQYAFVKANIPLNSDKNKYKLASLWFSSEDYNNNVRLVAHNYYADNPELYQEFLDEYLIPEDEGWNWHNKNYWNNYKNYRQKTQNYKIYANLIASGFILNRLFSVLDSVIFIKNKRKMKLSSTVDLNKKQFGINYEVKF